MKTLIALALLFLTAPVLAGPPSEGAFYDPDGDVFGEGIFVTTSLSGKISFSFFTTLSFECDEESFDCGSEQAWLVSGLNSVNDGQSQGILSTVVDEEVRDVGWYIFTESDTGYILDVLCADGSPIDCDQHIFTTLFDFNTCIVSADPACSQ